MAPDSSGPNGFLKTMQARLSAMETAAETPEFAEQTSEVLHLEAWRQLALNVIAVADPCALVTPNAAVAGAGGQQASLQLPHGMESLPLAEWPATYQRLFETLVVAPANKLNYLFLDENNPCRVWREGRAPKAATSVYPDDMPGRKPSKRPNNNNNRVGIPRGHDLESWRPMGGLLYPPPAPEHAGSISKWFKLGAAGFAAASPDPRNPQGLPRLDIRREDSRRGS